MDIICTQNVINKSDALKAKEAFAQHVKVLFVLAVDSGFVKVDALLWGVCILTLYRLIPKLE